MQNRANVSICINNVLKDLHWKERECKNAKGEKLFQDVRVRATLMICHSSRATLPEDLWELTTSNVHGFYDSVHGFCGDRRTRMVARMRKC